MMKVGEVNKMTKLYTARFLLAMIVSFLAGVVVEECHLVVIPLIVVMLGVIGAFVYEELDYESREERRHHG